MGVYDLLVLYLLLVLGAPTSHTQLVAAYEQVDFSIFDNGNGIGIGIGIGIGMYTKVAANTIFDILTRPFEHSVEIDADQIFPNDTLKHEIISKPGSSEFEMPALEYNLLGFNISATDIEVVASAKKITDDIDQRQK
jgi:hypothetical protein